MCDQQTILIIDDDLDYSCLLQLAFQEGHADSSVELIPDGWAAVNYLRRLAHGGLGGIMPGLVLLDLRMPGFSGLEVLRWIRARPSFADVPVVVFTGVVAGDEQAQAIGCGATSLRLKPFSYRALVQEASSLRETYLEHPELRRAA